MVLAAISPIFSSFTDHGPLHSLEIIQCIERILGTGRIRQLGPTDVWLILESAFRHDTGMHVTDEEIDTYVSSPEYVKKLETLSEMGDTELAYAAKALLEIKNVYHDGEVSDESVKIRGLSRHINLVLQDYYRSRHAQRSSDAIKAQHTETHSTDADSLVQTRLWKRVAEICASHSWKSEDVFNTLPRREKGYGNDVSHPCFVAFLLRVGDLLDLDNNRVNPNMLKLWGKDIPNVSKAHIMKHAALERLYISQDAIEAVVRLNLKSPTNDRPLGMYFEKERSDYVEERDHLGEEFKKLTSNQDAGIREDANKLVGFLAKRSWNKNKRYNTDISRHSEYHDNAELVAMSAGSAKQWFAWIDDELSFIAKNWLDIVPEGFSGGVPRFRQKDILINDHKFNNSIINLKYEISHERAASIIMSTGLYGMGAEKQHPRFEPTYNHEFVFLREFIQNAMDSTKVQTFRHIRRTRYGRPTRFYYENTGSNFTNSFKDWSPEKIFHRIGNAIKEMTVKVRVHYYTNRDDCRLLFEIKDKGTGIDQETLRYMSNVGKTRGPAIEREINEMPEWLKPSGSFGIGMQSAFGVVDKFRASSWSRKDFRNRSIYFHRDYHTGRLAAIEHEDKDVSMSHKDGTKFVIPMTDADIEKTALFENRGLRAYMRDVGLLFRHLELQFHKMLERDIFPIQIKFFVDEVELKRHRIMFDPLFPIGLKPEGEDDDD